MCFIPWIFSYYFSILLIIRSTIIKTKLFYTFSGKFTALINLLDPHFLPFCLSLSIAVASVFIACFLFMCFFLQLFLLAVALSFRVFALGVFNPGENFRISSRFIQHYFSDFQSIFWMNQEF